MSENSPGNELDKVVVERDAGASIEDGGVGVTDEVRGHHLQNTNHTTDQIYCGVARHSLGNTLLTICITAKYNSISHSLLEKE